MKMAAAMEIYVKKKGACGWLLKQVERINLFKAGRGERQS